MKHFFLFFTTRLRPALTGLLSLLLLLLGAAGAAQGQTANSAVTSISPTSGPVGTRVTIQGVDLGGVFSVRFGSDIIFPATSSTSTFVSRTNETLVVDVPAGARTGPVFAVFEEGQRQGPTFTVTSGLPTLSSIAPAAAPIGASVTLNGTNLTGTSLIQFQKPPAEGLGPRNQVTSGYTVNAAGTQITGIIVPAGVRSGDVTVTTPQGVSNGVFFSWIQSPTLSSLSPSTAPVGTSITLSGNNLSAITGVSFNGTPALVFSTGTGNSATATVPVGATSGNVTVTTPGGVSNGVTFTVGAVLPALTSIAPTSGPRGATVTLNGSNLTGTSSIRFANDFSSPLGSNLVTTGFVVNAAGTQITGIVVPSGAASGGVSVVAGGESNTVNFTVIRPVVLNAPNPTSGLVGSNVTLTSSNGFMSGITAVRFNGVAATVFAAPNDNTATAVVPAGATSGPITVTNAAGVSNGVQFTVTASVPVLSSLSPSTAPVGTSITLNGSNLSGITGVSFNGTAALVFTAGTGSSATATVPAGATSGNVTVTTPGGTSGGVAFTVAAAPAITSFSPARGPAGTLVTITGTDLDLVRGVRFGGGSLTANFGSQSATSLTVRVPVVSGTGVITLTSNTGATTSTATNFTYEPRQNLTATLSPAGPLDVCAARTLTAAALSPAFVTGAGFNDEVLSVAALADGKVLVGGNFTTYQSTAAGRLVRLNADGSLDASFATGTGFPGGFVWNVAVQADGKVLVGGGFNSYNGTMGQNNLVRLNVDGSLDASFATGTGFDNNVLSVVVQADGKVLVGGFFTQYQGATANRLIRLNADGSRDTGFTTGTGFNETVLGMAVQADGKVLAGGFFTRYQGTTANRLIRLNADGSRDAGFATGTGFGDVVFSMVEQADGKVLAGGEFGSYQGMTASRLVRLNADGSLDASFATGAGFNATVRSVAVQADGKVLAGGFFTRYQGTTANRLIRLNADGSRDASFATGTGFTSDLRSVAVQANGKVLAGGTFTEYNGTTGQNRLVRLNADGTLNSAATAVSGASFTFSPGNTTTNPLVTSTAGSYSATASLNGETSAPSNTVVLTACPAPVLSNLNPTSGPVGTSVTLTGSNLDGATAVTFAGTSNNTVTTGLTVSGTGAAQTLTVLVPTGAATGNVTVTTPNGTSNGLPFTVADQDLVVLAGIQKQIDASTPGAELSYRDITVEDGGELFISGAELRGSRTVLIRPGGRLMFSNGGTLAGAASFTLREETTLVTGDVAGISASGNTGSIRTTGARSFSSAASYDYRQAARATGSGLPGTVARLSIATDNDITLTAPVAVSRRVSVADANLELDGKALTLLSSASGTALVANFGNGIISGTTGTMQRYIGTNINDSGYRHYSSPVQNETFSTLAAGGYVPNFSGAAEYNRSATPGRVTPFPTVFGYSQDRIATSPSNFSTFDKGWEAATAGTEPMTVGRGYAVQAPGSILVDFTGQFTSGIFTRDGLRRSPDGQGSTAGTGWHLLGNPYPAPLDWNTMRIGEDEGANLQRLDAAMYVVESSGPYTGTYRTYLAEAPNDELSSPIIPAGQGFFVRTSSPNAAGAIRLTNDNRVEEFSTGPAFGRGPNDERPIVRLSLGNAAGSGTDRLTLYADARATAGVDARYDAAKLGNPSGLNLSAVSATGEALAVDARPAFAAGLAVALRLSVPADGTYTLRALRVANLPAGLVAYLHDAATGRQVSLAAEPNLSLPLTAGLNTRYSVVFAAANVLASAPALTAAQVVLFPNPAGKAASVTVTLPVAAGTRAARATVLNALGQVVSETVLTVQSGQANGRVRTAGLAAGVYVVRLQAGDQVVSKRLVVE